jgi:hypothetical protein
MIEVLLLCVIIYALFYVFNTPGPKSEEKKAETKPLSAAASSLRDALGFMPENHRVTISMENVIPYFRIYCQE